MGQVSLRTSYQVHRLCPVVAYRGDCVSRFLSDVPAFVQGPVLLREQWYMHVACCDVRGLRDALACVSSCS